MPGNPVALPDLRISQGVLDQELLAVVGQPDSLDHLEVFGQRDAVVEEVILGAEVPRDHDQGVVFPAANRFSLIGGREKVRIRVLAIIEINPAHAVVKVAERFSEVRIL